MEHVSIPARDGYALRATIFGNGPRTVVVNSATAVPRRFYTAYAEALAEQGYTVVTYDYRGIGESRPASLRGFSAKATDWAMLDMAAVLDHAAADLPGDGLLLLGHSIGGQVAGLLDNAHHVTGMITFSAQSGHWRHQGGNQKAAVALHTHLTLPVLAHTLGYVPWSKLSSAEDLPKHVAIQWARWCRHRRYLLGDTSLPLHRYAEFDAPVLAYSIDDDNWGTARAVDAMMSAYPNVERRHLRPAEHGLRKLGHFGFFRRDSRALWQQTFDWFAARASMTSSPDRLPPPDVVCFPR